MLLSPHPPQKKRSLGWISSRPQNARRLGLTREGMRERERGMEPEKKM